MKVQVNTDLRNISSGPKWRGHFDGPHKDGHLHGWAFVAADPHATVELDLYVHDVLLASTKTGKSRSDVDRILGLETPAATGFTFELNLEDIRPEGALQFLRNFTGAPPEVNLRNACRVCIGGTQHKLPMAATLSETAFDLKPRFPALVRAASVQLRSELAAGADPANLDLRDQEILLHGNPLFSDTWYRDTHEEVSLSGLDPVEHFIRLSPVLNRSPSPWFDNENYLSTLSESPAPLLPVVHYDLHGHDYWWPGQGRFRSMVRSAEGDKDYAVLIHLYHLDTVPDLQLMLKSFPQNVDVFISIPKDSPAHDPNEIAELFPRATEVMTVPNLGQDVAAFLETVRRLKNRGYRFFCKAHSKKGNKYPETWRRVMYDALAATPERVKQTVDLFRSNNRVLIAGPKQFWLNGNNFDLGSRTRLKEFTADLGLGDGALSENWGFFAGTCFWIDAELARYIAETVPATAFDETEAAHDGQTAQAVGRLFSVLAGAVGGQTALLDGCDWSAPPAIASDQMPAGMRMRPEEDAAHFLTRTLRALRAPKTVEGTASEARVRPKPKDIFFEFDTALHGAIDVMVSCWNGRPELFHRGIGELGRQLELNGLTWTMLVASVDVRNEFQAASCRNVVTDSLYLRFPEGIDQSDIDYNGLTLEEDKALSLLKSEFLFLKKDLPSRNDLSQKILEIKKLYDYWKEILVRHKVKMFLIWGNTAPKSRLFINICEDLGIEYQIIERGHFPGTLSIDPIGQFGTGVQPQLLGNTANPQNVTTVSEERFLHIRNWYETQSGHAAYAHFQKRGTRELNIIHRAKAHKRPVILVIGGNDQGGGVVMPDPDPLRVNWFGSSDGAFDIIRNIVATKFPDALLVLRPHPSQREQSAEFVIVARETSLDELIDASDLCITIGSTSRAICLLKGKPMLTLGSSELNGYSSDELISDATHLLSAMRRQIWSDFSSPYPNDENKNFIVDLFDRHLVGISEDVPTRYHINDLARHISRRIQRMKSGFLDEYAGIEDQISKAMFEDVRKRGRAQFPVDRLKFSPLERPKISVVLPIYGDYEGTRICFEQLLRHQAENGYRVIMVWDRGPDVRLRDLCLEYSEKAGFTYLENRENVGFSGTVNNGILHAGRDDIILLNSDTIPCGDWALRLQDAAYAHPKIASVVPFSNNATIYNVPFMEGMPLPQENPVEWAENLDNRARSIQPFAVEMPVSHGYCTYVKRTMYDRIGLYDEIKFGIGQSEDNEFSLRARMAGYFCVCPTNILVAHAGSTSFGDEIGKWLENGRTMLRSEFSHYFPEIRHFLKLGDPLDRFRKFIVNDEDTDRKEKKQVSEGKNSIGKVNA